MRYDCDGYDGSPYDGSGTVEIWLSGSGIGEGSGIGDLFVGAIWLSGSGIGNAVAQGHVTIEIFLSGSGIGEGYGTGSLFSTVYLSGRGIAHGYGTGDLFVYAEAIFTFSGSLGAGKTLVIDGQKFTVVNDGVNAIGDFVGEFPVLYPGTNLLKYTDSEGSRTVHIHFVKPGPPSTTETPVTQLITYSGTLAAGKTLVIDGTDLTVENDGTNDLAHFAGDFPRIFPGANTITYTDSAGSRTMKIAVIRQERST